MSTQLTLFHPVASQPWWTLLTDLLHVFEDPSRHDMAHIRNTSLQAATALAVAGFADVPTAVLSALRETSIPSLDSGVSDGLRTLLRHDLHAFYSVAHTDFATKLRDLGVGEIPLRDLATRSEPWLATWKQHLSGDEDAFVDAYIAHVTELGTGVTSVYPAVRWQRNHLIPVAQPNLDNAANLHGVDEQLATLHHNTEALIGGKPAHNVLLYGPRGSGKSTALRALGSRYFDSGLRLVEVSVDDLAGLDVLLIELSAKPLKFIVFVDDLAFDDNDTRYRPIKTMLDGGLQPRPDNVAVYATSNRRHIVKESVFNRPDPLDDDLHRFDAEHEKLALADRFGITITFPGASQRRYLEIVRSLAEQAGITDEHLNERAIRFADWHNGYSGRTAKQFIDELIQSQ